MRVSRQVIQDVASWLIIGSVILAPLAAVAYAAWYVLEQMEREEATVTIVDSQLQAGALDADTPAGVIVYRESETQRECVGVPTQLVDESQPRATPDLRPRGEPDRAPPGRLTMSPPDAGPAPGLQQIVQSRHPFLYLPLLKDGPAIEHTDRFTTVSAYSQNGRGYQFTYRYSPPSRELFLDLHAHSSAPLAPILAARGQPPDSGLPAQLAAGAQVGYRFDRFALHIGPTYHSQIGLSAHAGIRYRILRWRF